MKKYTDKQRLDFAEKRRFAYDPGYHDHIVGWGPVIKGKSIRAVMDEWMRREETERRAARKRGGR